MLLCYCGTAFGWGKSGHDAIAYIAECNLTPKARKNIEKYLDGRSIVYYASWMDVYRHTPAYKVTSGWHGDTVDADGKYVPNAKGDAVQCIEEAIARLKDYRSLDDSDGAGVDQIPRAPGGRHALPRAREIPLV